MKVTIDGKTHNWPVLRCTGYRAESVSLDEHDLRHLAALDSATLFATVAQLAGRVRPPVDPNAITFGPPVDPNAITFGPPVDPNAITFGPPVDPTKISGR